MIWSACKSTTNVRESRLVSPLASRLAKRLLGISLLAGALAVGPMAHADDHGDDLASATRVTVPSETDGVIDPGNDADWFRFEVSASGELTAETTGDLDTVGALYDADGNELAANDDSSTLNFRIQRTLDAGTYYIQVTSFGNNTGSYVLHLRDVAPPTVSDVKITSSPATGDTYELSEFVRIVVEFDRRIIVTGDPQLALTIGSTTRQVRRRSHGVRDLEFQYRVQSSDLDADGISIGADALTLNGGTVVGDSDGTNATLDLGTHAVANSANHKVDGSRETAPTVSGLSIERGADGLLGLGEVIDVVVTFDRAVYVSGTPQLALTIGSTTRQATFRYTYDSRQSLLFDYIVQSSDLDADGIGVGPSDLALNGGRIWIADGTLNAMLSLGDHAVVNSTIRVDGTRETAPTVDGMWINSRPAESGGTYELGERIGVTVYFYPAVEVVGTPQLALNIGPATRQADCSRISRNRWLYCEYVVQASDSDTDGISVGESALTLNGGTITIRGGTTNAALGLGARAFANAANHKVDGSRQTVPTVSAVWIGRPAGGDTFELGETITVFVRYDRTVVATGRLQLALTIGSTMRQASVNLGYIRREPTIYFSYDVQPSDLDKDGISIGASAITLDGGTIRNAADTAPAALDIGDHAIANSANHKVDGSGETAPAVRSVWVSYPRSGDTYELGGEIAAYVYFDRRVDVTGRPTLGLTIGSVERQASLSFSSGSTLGFRYFVQSSDVDADGISIGENALTLNGGTVRISGGGTNALLSLRSHAISNLASHKVDGGLETAPAVLSFSLYPPQEGDTYEFGEVIVGWVYFDRPVDVTGEPQLGLTIGSATRQASYFRQWASGQALLFQYVVGAPDADLDGISVDPSALSLNDGTIRTRGGAANASLGLGRAIDNWQAGKVDGSRMTPPTVTNVAIVSDPAGGDYSAQADSGGEIVVRVGFDRAVDVSGVPQLALTIGGVTRQASYVEYLEDGYVARDARVLYFRYVVQMSDHDPDGISVGTNALSLNGGTITTRGSGANAALEIGTAEISDAWVHKVNAPATARVDDHGDDLSSATRVGLPSETTGVIGPGNDTDWFRFEVSTSTEVVAETNGDLVDTVGTLYDADGSVLTANDDSSTLNFRIQRTLDAGTYYVVVRSFGRTTGSYALHLVEAVDHGDSLASATRVALPSETDGAIDPGDDVDRFQFDVPARGEVTVETTGILDTVGTLYDANGNRLAFDDDSGADWNFHIQRTLDAGSYFVQVASFASRTGSYVLHLRNGDSMTLATPRGSHLRNLGDFDGDGKDDVLLRHDDGRWRYYRMDGGTILAGSGGVGLPQDLAWQIAGIADFDGDGKDDVLLRHEHGYWNFYPMDGRRILAGSGTANLTAILAWQVAGIADFDGDGKADVLLRHQDGHWHFYPMDGRTVLAGSGAVDLTTDLAWQVAGIGDFDGDDRADVLLRHQDGRWHFYPMDGRTVLAGGGTADLTTNLAWQVVGIGDFDGDGKDDVLLRRDDGRWRYYPMDGRAVRPGGGGLNLTDDPTATVAGIGDMNGDGRADVLTRHADGSWYYYALDGRRLLPETGEAILTGNLAWGTLSGGSSTGIPTTGTPLSDQSLTLGRDEAIDLSEAFVDEQLLTYEVRSSDPDVVRTSVTGDVLTLMPVAEGMATVTVTAQDPGGNTASQTFAVTVGESADGLIAEYLRGRVAEGRSPALFAAIVDEHGLRAVGAAGVRRQGSTPRATVNDLLHIGSNTKAMTATMLATLVEDRTFVNGWQTTVADVYPDLLETIHATFHSVTLWQLVTMTAGLARDAPNWWAHGDLPMIERRQTILSDGMARAPAGPIGQFLYSNLSYMVAGAMAERVTGETWEALMEERLFVPLGMSTASFGVPNTQDRVDQPWGHRRDDDAQWRPYQRDNPSALGPAGTVHLSLIDWARFLALWLPRNTPAILDRSRLDELTVPATTNYAAGWGVWTRSWAGGTALAHSGSNLYWNTVVWVAPSLNRGFIAAANARDDGTSTVLDDVISHLIDQDAALYRETTVPVRLSTPDGFGLYNIQKTCGFKTATETTLTCPIPALREGATPLSRQHCCAAVPWERDQGSTPPPQTPNLEPKSNGDIEWEPSGT